VSNGFPRLQNVELPEIAVVRVEHADTVLEEQDGQMRIGHQIASPWTGSATRRQHAHKPSSSARTRACGKASNASTFVIAALGDSGRPKTRGWVTMRR
jgi:hypothetical protein